MTDKNNKNKWIDDQNKDDWMDIERGKKIEYATEEEWEQYKNAGNDNNKK